MRCSGGLSRSALGTSRVLWGRGPRLAAAPGLRPLSSVRSGAALALPVIIGASPLGSSPVSPCVSCSFGLGGPTPAVSGRRPDETFQFKHIRQRAAVTSTALVRRVGSAVLSPASVGSGVSSRRLGLPSVPGTPRVGTALRHSVFPALPLGSRRLGSTRA